MAEYDEIEEDLAKALHAALKRSSPHAWNGGSEEDAVNWGEMSFDGQFKPRLVAKHLLAHLSHKWGWPSK
jgi:hypothetical protein